MTTVSYAIYVRVIQAQPSAWLSIVEKTVWHYAEGGTWTECDDEHTLTMNGSGTSGMLRFKNPQGDYFLVALGIHNYKRWCDIVPDAALGNTGIEIYPTYYANGTGIRREMVWKQLANVEKTTAKGVHIAVDYYKEDGNTLYATTTIAESEQHMATVRMALK
jgi:hypothetical protein